MNFDKCDGNHLESGDYSTTDGWGEELQRLLRLVGNTDQRRQDYEIVSGDATETFPKWLGDNPHAIFSHAHFDMDLYKPTKILLDLVIERMPKGGVLIFDELNCETFPGETLALLEVIGIRGMKLRKSKYQPFSTYLLVE